jgi:hypothetical protein
LVIGGRWAEPRLRGVIFGPTQEAARIHADAALPCFDDDYMIEQWPACCAVLKIS